MKARIAIFLALLILPASGRAAAIHPHSENASESVVADIASPYVSVTTGFSGADVLVFGSMRAASNLAITMTGPSAQATLRKKIRLLGFWIDRNAVIINDVPSYFALATSGAPELTPEEQQRVLAPLDLAQQTPNIYSSDADDTPLFYRALLDLQKARGLYRVMPDAVITRSGRLFRVTFPLPAGTPLGTYSVHIYSFAHDRLTTESVLPVVVREEGLSAAIYEASHTHALLYAIATLLGSVLLGGGSAWLFQRMR